MPTPEITLTPVDEKDIFLASPDILELVRGEITDTIENLSAAFKVCVTTDGTSLAFLEAIVNYTTQVQAIYEVAEMAGLVGLPEVCTFINGNLMALDTQDVAQPYFEKWPTAVLDYLQAPLTGSQSLVQMMQDRAWPVPLEEEKAHQLLSLLTCSSTTSEPVATTDEETQKLSFSEAEVAAPASEVEEDQTGDFPTDIGLEVSQEISLGSDELLDILTEELESGKEFLTKELQSFTTMNNQEAAFLEATENYDNQIQYLHVATEMLGLPGLQNVCTFLVDNVKLLSKRELAARTKAKKVLEAWPDLVLAYLKSPMDSIIPLLNHLRKSQWAQPLADDKAHELLGLLMQGSTLAPSRPAPPATKATPVAVGGVEASAGNVTAVTPEQVLTVPIRTFDNLIRSVGSNLSRSWRPIQERMKYVLQSNRGLTEQDLILQQKTFALENLVDVHGVTEIMPNRYNQVSPDEESFDALGFKEYQELHSVAHSFMESITNHRELALSIRNDLAKLETMFIHQQQLNQECEASVMATRMVPVNTILPQLQHLVQQTCRGTNKKAELEVSGTDILIDSDVLLNHLTYSLQHLLRDVMAHGIETPEERVLLGKPESGRIHLSFYREGNNVVVKCQNDGHGQRLFNTKATSASNVAVGFREQVLTVSAKTIDNLMRLVGELSISLGQIQERMKHVLQSTRMLTEHGGMLQQQTVALENLVDGRGVTGSSYSRVSHDENSVDTLELKEGHELHSIAHRFMESIADYRKLARSIRNDLAELETMFIHQQRLNQEFEASVMATRLVPVKTILSRLVRQTCRGNNKIAVWEVSGTDILIDRKVLSHLGDALQHILRDVMAHGIEVPEERVLLGKPEAGHIHLSFYREGNNVVVKCQDDGC